MYLLYIRKYFIFLFIFQIMVLKELYRVDEEAQKNFLKEVLNHLRKNLL